MVFKFFTPAEYNAVATAQGQPLFHETEVTA